MIFKILILVVMMDKCLAEIKNYSVGCTGISLTQAKKNIMSTN